MKPDNCQCGKFTIIGDKPMPVPCPLPALEADLARLTRRVEQLEAFIRECPQKHEAGCNVAYGPCDCYYKEWCARRAEILKGDGA